MTFFLSIESLNLYKTKSISKYYKIFQAGYWPPQVLSLSVLLQMQLFTSVIAFGNSTWHCAEFKALINN